MRPCSRCCSGRTDPSASCSTLLHHNAAKWLFNDGYRDVDVATDNEGVPTASGGEVMCSVGVTTASVGVAMCSVGVTAGCAGREMWWARMCQCAYDWIAVG